MAAKKRVDTSAMISDLSGSAFFPQVTTRDEPELPPWMQNLKLIPLSQIRKGRYQKRVERGKDQETYEQLEAQMRDSYDRGTLRLFIPVMPDPEDSNFYNPAQGMHRRIEIAQKIGITELPCYVHEYDRESLALGTFYENMGRQDLTIVELGLLFLQVRQDFGITQEECAIKFHVRGGRDYVKRCEAAGHAMPDVQELVFLAPDRSASVVTPLSQLDVFEEQASEKRTPIIKAFLDEKITAEGVVIAVQEVLNGGEFSLDEKLSKPGVATPKTVERTARVSRIYKTWLGYMKQLKSDPLSHTERTELEHLRQAIDSVLGS